MFLIAALAITVVGLGLARGQGTVGAVVGDSSTAVPAPGSPAAGTLAAPGPLEVPVLMYHYVDDAPPSMGPYSDDLTVRTHEFEAQMDYLAEHGYEPITLETLARALEGAALPAKPIVLTFDDGGLDNYTVVFPILRKHGFSATFFVITGKVGSAGYMSWDQLREMNDAGMIVGSHTVAHPDLTGVGEERLVKELAGSSGTIAEEIGRVPVELCYPAGAYDARAIEGAKKAGYQVAVTTKPGRVAEPAKEFEIPRVRMKPFYSIETFARLLGVDA